MKSFKTTAVCIPSKNYMVDLSERVREIKKLIDDGKYFTINRARQYGKTTTLNALENSLSGQYDVLSIDFQDLTGADYTDESRFVKGLAGVFCDARDSMGAPLPEACYQSLRELSFQETDAKLNDIFRIFDQLCRNSAKPVVWMMDEVDQAANHQIFLDFLGKLRAGYLKKEKNPKYKTFQSVILAGVTDVKHLKSRIRPADEHMVNSPWNIAADFDIDMSLSRDGIQGMLDDYEGDHHTGMDTGTIAGQLREYTNGYPYLVSRICEIVDTKLVPGICRDLHEAWTENGIEEAVKLLLSETGNSLFDSLTGKLTSYPDLKKKLRNILLRGETLAWLPYDEEQQQLFMYGLIRNDHNTVAVSNRIFERLLYAHFIGENDQNHDLRQRASEIRSAFVDADGWLDVPGIMSHFIEEHNRIHGENTEKFIEDEGRERFVTYVSAIINGTGTYDIEPQTRDHRRMDLVIHYLGRRYIIEMKIWHGDRYNEKGEKQICDYLEHYGLTTGYMLSFNFNKKKKPGVERVRVGEKLLYEGIV